MPKTDVQKVWNKKVIIDGQVYFYQQKAPFVPSGESLLGALEYDPVTDNVRCHECGQWFKDLARHATSHRLSAQEYKQRHGFHSQAALMSEGLRDCRVSVGIAHADDVRKRFAPALERRKQEGFRPNTERKKPSPWCMEKRNLHGTCQAQLLNRLNQLVAELNHTPTTRELNAAGIRPYSLCMAFNVDTVDDVYSLLGMPGVSRRSVPNSPKYSQAILIELLRDFYVRHERLPRRSDHWRGLIPSTSIYKHAFGTVENAYAHAGLAKEYSAEMHNGSNGHQQPGMAEVEKMVTRSRRARLSAPGRKATESKTAQAPANNPA